MQIKVPIYDNNYQLERINSMNNKIKKEYEFQKILSHSSNPRIRDYVNTYIEAVETHIKLGETIDIAKDTLDLDLVNNIKTGDERLWLISNVENITTRTIKEILKESDADTMKCSKEDMYEIVESTHPFVTTKLLKIKEHNLGTFTDNYKHHYLFYRCGKLVRILKTS